MVTGKIMTRRGIGIEQIRREIDAIDASMHELLMKRGELIAALQDAKGVGGARGTTALRPAREAQMLRALGHESVALLSNNPDKAGQLEELGVRVARRVRTGVHLTSTNERYLAAKASRAAHTLALPSLCVVSEGGLEPPRPIKGTSTSS